MDFSGIFYIFYIFETGSVYRPDANFASYKTSVTDHGKTRLVKGTGIWIYLGKNNLTAPLSHPRSHDMEVCKAVRI